jgi:hypothetical protein
MSTENAELAEFINELRTDGSSAEICTALFKAENTELSEFLSALHTDGLSAEMCAALCQNEETQAFFTEILRPFDEAQRTLKCGARTRAGTPCRRWSIKGKTRCRLHGGCSTGPKTRTGRKAIIASNQRRKGEKRRQAG